jgi:tetratricopeptide (TPR) repeat protein
VLGAIHSGATSQTSRVMPLLPLRFGYLKIRAVILSGDLARLDADLKTAHYRYERALEETAKLDTADDRSHSYTLELFEKLGNISLENKQYDEAEKYYHQATAFLNEHLDSINHSTELTTTLNTKLQQIQELQKKTHTPVVPARH